MKSILCIQKLTLALFMCLSLVSLGVQSQAANLNDDVKKLDDKKGECPCFDEEDLVDLIAPGNAMCTYNFNSDRRLRIFDQSYPSLNSTVGNAFTRAGVACYGPKVISGGGATGLPPVGGFAMYDEEGEDCRKKIFRAANHVGLSCECVTFNEYTGKIDLVVPCPDSLESPE